MNEAGIERQFAIYHAFQIILEIVGDLTAMVVKDLQVIPKDDYINIEFLEKENTISRLIFTL